MRCQALLILLLAAAALGGCGAATGEAGVQVSDAWVRAASGAAGGANSAAYMLIRGPSGGDRLVGAQSDVAQAVELHTAIDDGGVMQMRPVQAIDVPAGGEVALRPGGLHVMLIGVTRDLRPGDTVALTLQFERAGAVSVEAEVRAQ